MPRGTRTQEGKVDSSRSNFSPSTIVDDEASHYPATLELSRIFRSGVSLFS